MSAAMAELTVQTNLKGLIHSLGDRVHSVDEETFDLFAQELPSGNLGFIDPKAHVLDITVAGHDLSIHQSPAILSSNRAGGTTGAVVWKVTPVFADWISRPDNIFFSNGILTPQSTAIELGCGISAIVGLLLAPRISSYVLTDQPYVVKLLGQNMDENRDALFTKHVGTGKSAKFNSSSRGSKRTPKAPSSTSSPKLAFRPLDWETDTIDSSLTGDEAVPSFNAVLCCDCIYNETLVEPLVQTCADICSLRAHDEAAPCICIVAQQLRDSDVFEAWLTRFAQQFYVWRVPDSQIVQGLQSNSGFAVHVGVLKSSINS